MIVAAVKPSPERNRRRIDPDERRGFDDRRFLVFAVDAAVALHGRGGRLGWRLVDGRTQTVHPVREFGARWTRIAPTSRAEISG